MRALLPVIGVAALWLAGCGGEDDRPAPVTGCINGACGGSGGSGAAGGGGSGGTTCSPTPSFGTHFSGTLNVFESEQLDGSGDPTTYFEPYLGTAQVMIPAEPCGWVSDDYDSSVDSGFDLQGVMKEELLYVRMDPVDSQTPVLPTLMVVDGRTDTLDSPYYGLIKESSIDAILNAAAITRDPAKAQIIVRTLVGFPLTPAIGAKLSVGGAEAILYNSGGWTTSSADGAGNDGLVVMANVSADDWPGGPVTVVSNVSDDTYRVDIASGAITFLTVALTWQSTGP